MRVGGVQMIVGRIGAAARAEAVAITLRHARRDRRVIFHHVAVAVDDFVLLVAHGFLLLSKCHSEPQCEESRFTVEILRWRSG